MAPADFDVQKSLDNLRGDLQDYINSVGARQQQQHIDVLNRMEDRNSLIEKKLSEELGSLKTNIDGFKLDTAERIARLETKTTIAASFLGSLFGVLAAIITSFLIH